MLTALLTLTGVILVLLYTQAGPRSGGNATVPSHAAPPAGRAPQAGISGSPGDAGQDLAWVNFHGIQLPVSAQDGPHGTRGGLAWGFTDTPRGALLAAINIGVRTAALWGPDIYQPTVTYEVTGPDAAALLKADSSGYAALRAAANVPAGQPAGRGYAVEAAYRFTTWSPSAATVDVVTEGPGSSGTTLLAVTRVEVLWQHGDWRLVAPPGGDWANAAASISSLTGYTTFPGEG
jgi:hypothetical protein